jgi:hypothetical protein
MVVVGCDKNDDKENQKLLHMLDINQFAHYLLWARSRRQNICSLSGAQYHINLWTVNKKNVFIFIHGISYVFIRVAVHLNPRERLNGGRYKLNKSRCRKVEGLAPPFGCWSPPKTNKIQTQPKSGGRDTLEMLK